MRLEGALSLHAVCSLNGEICEVCPVFGSDQFIFFLKMLKFMACIIFCCFLKIRPINVRDERADRQLGAKSTAFLAVRLWVQ